MKVSKKAKRQAMELFRSCLVNGSLDENRAREVTREIVATKPRGAVGVLSYFLRLVKLDRAEHTANIESAAILPGDVHDSVRANLTQHYGPRLDTSFKVDPALIGGMRIQVGSDVFDSSVRGRLAALQRRLGNPSNQ